MAPVTRRKTFVAISAALVLGAAALAGVLAGLGRAGGTSTHAPRPYLRHPEYARKALLLAKAGGIHVTPALRAAARAQAARPRMLWRGASARFSVFSGAATPSQLPAEVRRFVAYAATATHLTPDTALARVRLLRSTVGSARGDLYALQGGDGAPCFILTHYGGSCGTAGSGQAAWVIGGGGQDNNPDILVGLAPDDVSAVSLTVDGRNVPVSLDHNVVFAQFATGGKFAQVATTRVDGTTTTEQLSLSAS
jgi:hypothetical protein